jgi:hypothetical protein
MVNEGQSFNQFKDKSHAMSTESIQRIISSEPYQPKLVQSWVDTIGQDIVNKLRVRKFWWNDCFYGQLVGYLTGIQVHRVCDDC